MTSLMKTEMDCDWMSSTPSPARICTICAAPSNGYHFNAASCSACAAFFRRTVTLDRHFVCGQENNCRVNYAMRVICRACRYAKCIANGMDRKAVQPRRDCNVGRRKISYAHNGQTAAASSDKLATAMQSSGLALSPEATAAAAPCTSSYSSSVEASPAHASPSHGWNTAAISNGPFSDPLCVVEELLREERLQNERRRILYCGRTSISLLLSTSSVNDIPFVRDDMRELTFGGIQKDIRAMILVIYEWIRGWNSFGQLCLQDKKAFLRRCILYHTILDPAYLTVRLGFPERFVMFNGMYVGIAEDSKEGWRDEKNYITSDLKKELYRPLLTRVVNEIVQPMLDIRITYTEYIVLKALVSWKSASLTGANDITAHTKHLMNKQVDCVLAGLNAHYANIGLSQQEIAERTGNLVLLMSSVFAVGLECLESHQKIKFFDLWELDSLLIQLLSSQRL